MNVHEFYNIIFLLYVFLQLIFSLTCFACHLLFENFVYLYIVNSGLPFSAQE